ncbi:MAG: hypothetical protein DME06_16340 [Candidatus Rokuibacteriota bacterium]|nr:MAG: hypothetical protein DME06_16340 [Candidatus Rokubacteria bacterium]
MRRPRDGPRQAPGLRRRAARGRRLLGVPRGHPRSDARHDAALRRGGHAPLPRGRRRGRDRGGGAVGVRPATRRGPARRCAVRALVTTALVVLAEWSPGRAGPPIWRVDHSQSRLVVHVFRRGLLSPALHDHHFVPERWSATVAFDPARPEPVEIRVTVAADSLRDRQPELSPEDLRKVEAQVRGPKGLDAERYPVIAFTADRLELSEPALGAAGAARGVLAGVLELHGRTRPVRAPLRALDGHVARRRGGSVRQAERLRDRALPSALGRDRRPRSSLGGIRGPGDGGSRGDGTPLSRGGAAQGRRAGATERRPGRSLAGDAGRELVVLDLVGRHEVVFPGREPELPEGGLAVEAEHSRP